MGEGEDPSGDSGCAVGKVELGFVSTIIGVVIGVKLKLGSIAV